MVLDHYLSQFSVTFLNYVSAWCETRGSVTGMAFFAEPDKVLTAYNHDFMVFSKRKG